MLFSIELKLKQTDELGLKGPKAETCRTNTDQQEAVTTGTELQQLNNNSNTKPDVEDTVNIMSNRLKERRRELGLPDSIKVDFSETPVTTNIVIQVWRLDVLRF